MSTRAIILLVLALSAPFAFSQDLYLPKRGVLGLTQSQEGLITGGFWGISNGSVGLLEIQRAGDKRLFLMGEFGVVTRKLEPPRNQAAIGVLLEL